jgi:hypothetical protein
MMGIVSILNQTATRKRGWLETLMFAVGCRARGGKFELDRLGFLTCIEVH